MADTEQPDVTAFTVQLLSAYLANNEVAHTELAELIRTTRQALVGEPAPSIAGPATDMNKPAVSIRKSLASPDFILSLVDGKPYKTLKRHLTAHGLTPQAYRERYKLPADYPLVAPGFAEQRRLIANKIGLGRRGAQPAAATAAKAATKAAPKTVKPKTAEPAVGLSAIPPAQAVAEDVTRRAPDASDLSVGAPKAAAAAKKVEPKSRPRAARGTLKLFANAPTDDAIAQGTTDTPSPEAKPKPAKAKPALPGNSAKTAKKQTTSDAPKN